MHTGVGGSLKGRALFAAVALASLGFGYWGLLRYGETSPAYGTSADDLLYWDLQLFVLGSSPAESGGDIPWMLQVARFGAPLATAYALVTTARTIFDSQLARLRARRVSGHVIVCGAEPAAAVLTRELVSAGEAVLVIDGGTDNAAASSRRSAEPTEGTYLVSGDARVEEVLRSAGVPRAREVMAVTSDSAFNAEVALAVQDLVTRSGAVVACHAEIADRQLCAAMVAVSRAGRGDQAADLTFFSRHDRAARDILERSSLVGMDPDRASVLIAGGGPLAQAVLLEIARLWDQRARRGSPPLPVVVLDPDGGMGQQIARTPLPTGAVDLALRGLHPAAVTGPGPMQLGESAGSRDPALVFVCLDDDTTAIRFGLTAVDLLPDAQVVVAVTAGTVFGELLGGRTDGGPHGSERLILHNVIRTVYASTSVRRSLIEEMARAAHSAYVAAARARGETAESNPSMVPWDELGDDLRRANLAQAADVERKLAAIGYDVAPAPTGQPLVLTDDEVEHLARLEHERWMDERRRQGWIQGARRDNEAKRHPDLVSWDHLSPESQDKDRDAVQELPELLRSAGLGAVRRPTSRPSADDGGYGEAG
jgi:hypothetical protein